MEATCPNCKANLKNAAPNLIGKIRCGACGQAFDAVGESAVQFPYANPKFSADAASGEPVNQAPLPDAPPDPAISLISPSKEPLGREPQPASYGLLIAVGFAVLIFSVAVFGWEMYRNYQLVGKASGLRGGAGLTSSNVLLKSALQGLLLPCAGLSILVLTGNVVRIDRRATWLAWRSGSLLSPITQPDGSSLPFILPFCVAGGVLLIFGMKSMQPAAWAGGSLMPEGTVIAGAGAVLFLAGLGCGELWRFFWRMGQLGKALTRRQRGDELSIGAPNRSSGSPAHPGNSSIFMRYALLSLFIAYVCVAWAILELISTMNQLYGDQMFSSGEVERPSTAPYYGNLLGAFIGIIGGAYTLFLLTRHWEDLVKQWRSVGASVRNPMPHVSEGSTSMFHTAAWIEMALLVLLGIYTASQIGRHEVRMAVVSLAGMVSTGFALCWLSGLKSETFEMRRVTARMARGASAAPTSWLPPFTTLLFALTVVSVGWGLYDIFSLSSAFGRIPLILVAYTVTLLMAGALPLIWLGLMVRDTDAIRANLEGIVEESGLNSSNP